MRIVLFLSTAIFTSSVISSCGQSVSPAADSPSADSPSAEAEGTESAEKDFVATAQISLGDPSTEAPSAAEEPPAIFAENNIAIRGADPVAYFTEGRYVPGSTEHTYEWADATWQFASAQNRDLFAANPEQYAPQYGGFCAWAVAEGYTAAVDPNAWEIVDDKLYLNFDARIQRRWQRDIPGNIARANENWPAVLSQ